MRLKSLAPTLAILIASTSFSAVCLPAQTTQEPSLAEAARRLREQKQTSGKATPVITNDTLAPVSTGASSALPPQSQNSSPSPATGTPGAPTPAIQTSEQATPAASTVDSTTPSPTAGQPELSAEDRKQFLTEIASLKQQFKDQQNQVGLLQRLLNLDRETFFSQTDYTRDTDGKARLDSEQAELKQAEAEFEKLKAKLESIAPQEIPNSTPPRP